MKAFALIRDDVELEGLMPYEDGERFTGGICRVAKIGQWSAVLMSGLPAQLQAIDALPGVIGICAWREGEDGDRDIIWNAQVASAARTKLNTWLEEHEHPTIPADWTNKQAVLAIYRRLNAKFDFTNHDVGGLEPDDTDSL